MSVVSWLCWLWLLSSLKLVWLCVWRPNSARRSVCTRPPRVMGAGAPLLDAGCLPPDTGGCMAFSMTAWVAILRRATAAVIFWPEKVVLRGCRAGTAQRVTSGRSHIKQQRS